MQWFINPVPGKRNFHTITAGPFPPAPGAPGFRRGVETDPRDVLNARLPGEWHFIPVEGLDGVFQSVPFSANTVYSTKIFQRIQPFGILIDEEELLGTEGDKVNAFPLQ